MEHKPAIPVKVRDITYFVLLGVAALALLAQGVAGIWLADPVAGQVADTAEVVVGVMALIGGGLGVAYRPGKQAPQTGAQSAQEGR